MNRTSRAALPALPDLGSAGRHPQDELRHSMSSLPDPMLDMPGVGQTSHEVIMGTQPTMNRSQFQGLINSLFRDCKIYSDRLEMARSEALRSYNGELFGDEEAGRSRIVLTEVKDTIAAYMPSVVRIFAGYVNPVEFLPRQKGDDDAARQATDYAEHIIFTSNNGFEVVHDAAMDALQLKSGWIHWFWDWTTTVVSESYFSLLEQQAQGLLSEKGVTAVRVVKRGMTPEEMAGLMGSPESQIIPINPKNPPPVFDCQITRSRPVNEPKIIAVPSEQVMIDADASGPQDSRALFYGRDVLVSDLVALGFSQATIEQHLASTRQLMNRVSRRRDRIAAYSIRGNNTGGNDPSLRVVRYWKGWIRCDLDGDGIAERRLVHCIGNTTLFLLGQEPAHGVPWARIVTYRVPHRAHGEAVADRIGELQKTMSRVMRHTLDSLSASIHPRTVVVENQANIDDCMNTEVGAVIREKQPGMVRELAKTFVGQAGLQTLGALQDIKQQRTGITDATQGMTPEALQSTTAIAVSAAVAAAQDRLELVLRCIAEGLKDAYTGIIDLMALHQDRARAVLMRGQWVVVDPRPWMQRFHVQVNVGSGRGNLDERKANLALVIGKQEQIMTTMGPINPLVNLSQYRQALADLCMLSGIVTPDRYFLVPPANWQPPPPKPTNEELVAQIERGKTAADVAESHNKLLLEREKLYLEDTRERDIEKTKAMIAIETLQLQWGYTAADSMLHAVGALLTRNPNSTALELEHPGSRRFTTPQDIDAKLSGFDAAAQAQRDARGQPGQPGGMPLGGGPGLGGGAGGAGGGQPLGAVGQAYAPRLMTQAASPAAPAPA